MTTSLAKKYRPRLFKDVIGQETIISTLQYFLKKKKYPDSIILDGEFGIGKTTLARIFANTLNCLEPTDEEPCGKCKVCESFKNENYFNNYYLEFDSSAVGDVNFMRDFIETLKGDLFGGKHRVVVFDEAQEVSKQAQSMLLKVIEENYTNNIFVFCTTAKHKLLDTIISRSFSLSLKPVSMGAIKYLIETICSEEEKTVDDKIINIIALKSRGHVRDAVLLLDRVFIGDVSNINDFYTKVGIDIYTAIGKLFLHLQDITKIQQICKTIFANASINYFRDNFYKFIELLLYNRAGVIIEESNIYFMYANVLTEINKKYNEKEMKIIVEPFFNTLGLNAFVSEQVFESLIVYLSQKLSKIEGVN